MLGTAGLHVTVWGEGDPAVLVHGSISWATETWAKQRPLAEQWRLVLPDRRGFGRSPLRGRVDFDRDADDVAELLDEPAHVVGHSYGGVVALLAASRRAEAVRSLTVIEPPALGIVRGNPAVEEFVASVERASREASDPSDYRQRFLRSFGFSPEREELTGEALEAARSSWRERPPWEAPIPFEALEGVRTLVIRGEWRAGAPGASALHPVCDELEQRLGAESATLPGAHNPQLAGGAFNERLRAFWEKR